jgi:thiol:disulfide interchange protein
VARSILALLLLLAAAGAVRAQGPRPDLAQLDGFTVAGQTGYSDTATFLRFIHDAEAGVRAGGPFEGRGPLAIIAVVLLGGLALNLTPCVLPMIPINLAIIGAGTRARSRASGALLGGAYGAAMAAVYGALGLVVILTAGTFGTLNASPLFNAALAVLFVVLGLAMLDVITIDLSRFSGGRPRNATRGRYALALTMGGVAALLAGACVAPVVIQVVLFSSHLYASGTRIALALPFCLGIGMAAPWPIVGGGLASLPRPGRWMIHVKRAFAAVIFATAAYYGYLACEIRAVQSTEHAQVTTAPGNGWVSSLDEGLAIARREGKPVLIDMWATWCRDCTVMDTTTLADARVNQALAAYVKIKYLSEQPDEPPVSDVLDRFAVVGLPAYVILRPPH